MLINRIYYIYLIEVIIVLNTDNDMRTNIYKFYFGLHDRQTIKEGRMIAKLIK